MATDPFTDDLGLARKAHKLTHQPHIPNLPGRETHAIVKDILCFHAIYPPTFFLSLNLSLPHHIQTGTLVHEPAQNEQDGWQRRKRLRAIRIGLEYHSLRPVQEGSATDDSNYGLRTTIDSYKKGCVNNLGELAGHIRRLKLDPARTVERSVV